MNMVRWNPTLYHAFLCCSHSKALGNGAWSTPTSCWRAPGELLRLLVSGGRICRLTMKGDERSLCISAHVSSSEKSPGLPGWTHNGGLHCMPLYSPLVDIMGTLDGGFPMSHVDFKKCLYPLPLLLQFPCRFEKGPKSHVEFKKYPHVVYSYYWGLGLAPRRRQRDAKI